MTIVLHTGALQMQEVVMMLLRVMVRVPLLLVGSLIMGILTSPQLSLLFLILIPVIVVSLAAIVRRTSPLFSGVQADPFIRRLTGGYDSVLAERGGNLSQG